MVNLKEKNKKVIANRKPQKKTSGIFDNLRKPHPIEEILGFEKNEENDLSRSQEKTKAKEQNTQELSTPGIEVPSTHTPEIEYPRKQLPQKTTTPVTQVPSYSSTPVTSTLEKGYFCPNWIDDDLMPTLQLSEQVVLRRLVRLSYGFNKQITDSVGVTTLARKCNLSEKGVKLAIKSLEDKRIIIVHRDLSGNPQGGNRYEIITRVINTQVTNTPGTNYTRVHSTHIKDDDDLKHIDHHQREVMKMYESITGNRWKTADSKAYEEIKRISLETIEQAMRVTKERAMNRPNSLKYFIKEILSVSNPSSQSKTQRKQALAKIVERIRTRLIGVGSYSTSDFIEDCKRECAREGVMWDNDLFNEVAGF